MMNSNLRSISTQRPASARSSLSPTVVVIGGGLAGLSATHELRRQLGRSVRIVVLEARPRLGGRVHSLPGGGEAGCEPPFFHRGPLLRMAEELGLEVRSYRGSNLDLGYHVDGRWVRAAEWGRFAEGRYPAPFDRLSPFRAWFPLTARFTPPARWADDPIGSLSEVDPSLATLSVAELLDRLGFPAQLQPMVPPLFHVFEDPRRISALCALMRGWSARPDGNFYYFDGSMSRVIEAAMEQADARHLDCPVTSVHMTEHGQHRVTVADGRTWVADHVVFALPARQALNLEVTPHWSPQVQHALQGCEYGPVIKVLLRTGRSLSSIDGLPDAMMADRGFSACFPVFDPETRHTPTSGPDVHGVELVFIGDRARRLQALARRGGCIADEAVAALVAARPAVAPYLQPEYTAVWTASSGPGALPYFSPRSDIPQLLAAMQYPRHRRYLVGDYTEIRYAGWDGAVASGLRAAGQIVQQVRQRQQLYG